MFVSEQYAKFESKILNETKVIQFLKLMRWHFCHVYIKWPRVLASYVLDNKQPVWGLNLLQIVILMDLL